MPSQCCENAIRVLHVEVGGAYGGSVSTLETYLAASVDPQLRHDVLFYFPTPHVCFTESNATNLQVLYPKGKQLGEPLLQMAKVPALLRFFRHNAYDVINLNNTFPYQASTIAAARLAHLPIVGHVRNPVRSGVENRALLRRLDCAVTANLSLACELESWGTQTPIVTCYDGPKERAIDARIVAELRQRLSPDGEIVIGSVGRLDKQKGYTEFVKAAQRVCEIQGKARLSSPAMGHRRLSFNKRFRLQASKRNSSCSGSVTIRKT